jgi:pimeloyl-ACP methyl ester carboxylesterase
MLAALVLVDTSSETIFRDAGYTQLRQKVDELARSEGLEAAFEYDAAHNPMRIERFQKHPEQKEVAQRKVLNTSVNGYIFTSRAIDKRVAVTDRLIEIKVPTLIFWGDEDTAFTAAVQVLKQGIAGSELVTVRQAGHSPHEEAPDIFNKALLKFLEQIKW